jgi:hypothetical protein
MTIDLEHWCNRQATSDSRFARRLNACSRHASNCVINSSDRSGCSESQKMTFVDRLASAIALQQTCTDCIDRQTLAIEAALYAKLDKGTPQGIPISSCQHRKTRTSAIDALRNPLSLRRATNALKPSVPKRRDVRTTEYTAVSTPPKEQSHLGNGLRHGVRR